MTSHKFKVICELFTERPIEDLTMYTSCFREMTYFQRCKLVDIISKKYEDGLPSGYRLEIRHGQLCVVFPYICILEGQTIDKNVLNDFA